jgi:hypothetical protein
LGQGDVLGHEGVGASELIGDLPCEVLQHAVAQQAQSEATQVVELAIGRLSVEFTALDQTVELGQHLGADQRGGHQLMNELSASSFMRLWTHPIPVGRGHLGPHGAGRGAWYEPRWAVCPSDEAPPATTIQNQPVAYEWPREAWFLDLGLRQAATV